MPQHVVKLRYNIIIVVFLSLLIQFQPSTVYSQNNAVLDSMYQQLETLSGTAYIDQLRQIAKRQDIDSVKLQTYFLIIKESNKINYLKGLEKANVRLGEFYSEKADLAKSIKYFDEAIKYAKLMNSLELEMDVILRKNHRIMMSGRTEEAFTALMEALQRVETEGVDPKINAEVHFELGEFHRLQHDVDKAVFHFNKALAYFKKEKELTRQAQIIYAIGNVYKIGETAEYNQMGIEYMNKLLAPPYIEILPKRIQSKVKTSLGGMLVWGEEYEKGEQLLLESLAEKEERKDTVSMVYSFNELATLYSEWNKPDKSIIYGEKALTMINQKDDIFSVSDSYKNLSKAYAKNENYTKAYLALKKVEQLQDSVVNQKKAIALADMETKYRTDIQNEKLARQELMIRQQKYTTAAIIGTLLLFGFITFLWLQTRLKFRAKEAKQLEALNASKTRFFTNISHELRTPLTLLINPLRQLQTLPKSNDATISIPVSGLDRMIRNGERLERLIKQMTNLSKLEEGNYQLKTNEYDLVEFTNSIVDSFISIADEQDKELEFFSTENTLMMYFDAEKMEDILLNLLFNAFKFTNEKDTIKVLITTQNGNAQIQIQDSGIGIKKEQQAFIFDRFYQSNDRDTRQHEGMGIGLSLVQEMVKLHHGNISVESTLGEKTCFSLNFPLGKNHLSANEIVAKHEWQPKKVQILGQHKLNTKTSIETEKNGDQALVLIVEDNPDLLAYLREQLETHYNIIIAQNGQEGLEQAFNQIPEIILSDVMMPEMDGFEFCKTIKSDHRTSHIPTILLTAKADVHNIKTGLDLGADDYITKPFNQEILFAKINNLINQRRQLRVLFSEKLVVKSSDIKVSSKEDQFLVELLEIIEQNIGDANFGVEELSRAIGFSRSQFYRKLKALTDQSPAVFIRTIRLDRAKQLLEQSAGNASEIAYMVGFNNPNYFFKCFKDQFGMTPKDVLSKVSKI